MSAIATRNGFYMHPYAFAGCVTFRPDVKNDKQYAEQIINIVCQFLAIDRDKINIRCRKREICFARQASIYVIKQYTKLSLKDIALLFGEAILDHTTVLHNINVIKNYIDTDTEIKNKVEIMLRKTRFPTTFN